MTTLSIALAVIISGTPALHWQPVGDHVAWLLDGFKCKDAWSISAKGKWTPDPSCAQSWMSAKAKMESTHETGAELVKWQTPSGGVCVCKVVPK